MNWYDGMDEGQVRLILGLERSPHPVDRRILDRFRLTREMAAVSAVADMTKLVKGVIPFAYMTDASITNRTLVVGMNPDDSPKGATAAGRPGSGKSNHQDVVNLEIAKFCARTGQKVTIFRFDCKKGDGQYLLIPMSRIFSRERVVHFRVRNDSTGNFSWNPSTPASDKISPVEWDGIIADALAKNVFDLREEGTGAVLGAIQRARQRLPEGVDPCFYDMYLEAVALQSLHHSDNATTGYYSRSKDSFGRGIKHAQKMLGYRKAISFQKLADEMSYVSIDLSRADAFIRKLILVGFLTSILKWSQYEGKWDQDMRVIVLIDEGHEVFMNRPLNAGGETVIDSFSLTGRTYGTWPFIASQSLVQLSNTCKLTTGTKVVFALDELEIPHAVAWLGLTDRDQIDRLRNLGVGQAYIKRPGFPAFLGEFPLLNLDKSIPESEIDRICEPAIKNLLSDSQFVEDDLRRKVLSLIYRQPEQVDPKPEVNAQEPPKTNFQEHMKLLLASISRNQFAKFGEHKKFLLEQGVKGDNYHDRLRKALFEKGWIEIFKGRLERRRGGDALYAGITLEGQRVLPDDFKDRKRDGNESYPHRLFKEPIVERYTAAGYRTSREFKDADIAVFRETIQDGKTVLTPVMAVEISICTEASELANVHRNLLRENGFPCVLIIAVEIVKKKEKSGEEVSVIDDDESKNKCKRLASLIGDNPCVRVMTFADFRDSAEVPIWEVPL